MSPPIPPPAEVRAAFGVRGGARPLPGGQESSWLVGDLVLKPGVDPALQEWTSSLPRVGSGVEPVEVVASRDGRWAVDGWGATRFAGEAVPLLTSRDWSAVIGAGRALHRAWADVPPPAWLEARDDPWARADRAAWDEGVVAVHPDLAAVATQLRDALTGATPVDEPQLVHGDLSGNVLARPDGTRVVIDLSPYRRPPSWAEGVVVADALTWHDAAPDLADDLGVPRDAVLRALLFRVLTSSELARRRPGGTVVDGNPERYARVADLLGI